MIFEVSGAPVRQTFNHLTSNRWRATPWHPALLAPVTDTPLCSPVFYMNIVCVSIVGPRRRQGIRSKLTTLSDSASPLVLAVAKLAVA